MGKKSAPGLIHERQFLSPTTSIVTSGPFRFSRNPLYVALTLLYWGARLDVQYVVGHYRARPAPYHYALRSCPARGELHRAEVW